MICVQLDKTLKTRHMHCDHVSDWTKAHNVKVPLNMRHISSKHVTKHIICWNKVGLTWTSKVLWSFDDNKVLKLQLELLMIILVCRITSQSSFRSTMNISREASLNKFWSTTQPIRSLKFMLMKKVLLRPKEGS
jgi:hypothetical protein